MFWPQTHLYVVSWYFMSIHDLGSSHNAARCLLQNRLCVMNLNCFFELVAIECNRLGIGIGKNINQWEFPRLTIGKVHLFLRIYFKSIGNVWHLVHSDKYLQILKINDLIWISVFIFFLQRCPAKSTHQQDMCVHWILRSNCASTKPDQSHCFPYEESFGHWLPMERLEKTLIRLRRSVYRFRIIAKAW